MSVYSGPEIVNDSLILHLDAANLKSYPGSGTNVFNLVGNNTHVLRNATPYTVLSGIPCFDCSSGSYYLSPVTANQQLPTSGYTYVSMARMQPSTTEWRTLWRTTADDHPLIVQAGGVLLGMYDNNSTGFNSSGYDTTPLYNTWCQWTIVGSIATGTTFYINGTQVGTSVAQSAAGNFHNAIGGAGGSQPFGHIGTAMLYSRMLNLAEIQQNFNALRGRFGI